MADDLIEEEMDETEELREIHREDGDMDPGSGRLAKIRRIVSNRRRLVIVIAGVLVLILAAGGLYLFFSGSKEAASPEGKAVMTEADVKAALEKEPEILFEDIVVMEPLERISLKSSSAMKMINLDISLELTDPNYRKAVIRAEDRLRKIIQGQVREMTWLELRNPEGKIRLKYELLKRMNSIFPKVTIRNVYFTNFIMQ